MDEALIVDSPIHSVFITPNTPGSRVPSHGTAEFGEMYAIDFVVVDRARPSRRPYRPSPLSYVFSGLKLEDFYGWGEKIYSPVEGRVVKAIDGIEERDPARILRDLRHALRVTRAFERNEIEYSEITGNCVIIQYGGNAYCLLAHLKNGSVRVEEGQTVQRTEVLGELGHSGNSTMPHLHMQFMDSLDFRKAKGLPFKLREYSTYREGRWENRENGLPTDKEILRYGEF